MAWTYGSRGINDCLGFPAVKFSPRLFLHLDTRKCELIHFETSCWKEEVIRQIFLPLDVEVILSIPLSA